MPFAGHQRASAVGLGDRPGHKLIENRDHSTEHRGPLLIHASMRVDLAACDSPLIGPPAGVPPIRSPCSERWSRSRSWPRSVRRTGHVTAGRGPSRGAYHWRFTAVRPLPRPVVALGRASGLWDAAGGGADRDRRRPCQSLKVRTIPDVLPEPGQRPSPCSSAASTPAGAAATGHHFARPGNRFWPVLHLSGFTDRRLEPREQDLLPGYGLGITNLVARPSAKAAELTKDELIEGGAQLRALVERPGQGSSRSPGSAPTAPRSVRPRRSRPAAGDDGGHRPLGHCPNPSGLNAHWTAATMAEEFARLKRSLTN